MPSFNLIVQYESAGNEETHYVPVKYCFKHAVQAVLEGKSVSSKVITDNDYSYPACRDCQKDADYTPPIEVYIDKAEKVE